MGPVLAEAEKFASNYGHSSAQTIGPHAWVLAHALASASVRNSPPLVATHIVYISIRCRGDRRVWVQNEAVGRKDALRGLNISGACKLRRTREDFNSTWNNSIIEPSAREYRFPHLQPISSVRRTFHPLPPNTSNAMWLGSRRSGTKSSNRSGRQLLPRPDTAPVSWRRRLQITGL